MTEPMQRVTVRHWRVVDDKDGGISYSISSREESWPERAVERAGYWLRPGTHLEVWDQEWQQTFSEWTRVEEPAQLRGEA